MPYRRGLLFPPPSPASQEQCPLSTDPTNPAGVQSIEIHLPLTFGEQRMLAALTPPELDEVRVAAVDAAVAAAIRIRARKSSVAGHSVDLRDQPPAD